MRPSRRSRRTARRAEQTLLVDGDDFGDALRAVRRNLRDGRIGYGVVRGASCEHLVVAREAERELVEHRGRELFGARGQQDVLWKPSERVAGGLRHPGGDARA